jgi:cytochrome c oxidase assembly protein subunit 15
MPDTTSIPAATPQGLRRWAMFCVGFCVFLLLAGANVNTQDGGLTVPDWPRMYYEWVPGWDRFWQFMGPAPLRAEVLHRYVAQVMGILTIVLALWAQRRESRSWVKKMCWAALGLVIVQGVWGGLGVLFKLEGPWPLLHSTTAQLYLCLLVAIASVMSPWWRAAEGRERALDDDALRLMKLSLIATAALFVQLILGAAARHGMLSREIHAVVAMPVAIVLVKLVLAGAGDMPRDLIVIRRPASLIGYLVAAQVGLGLWTYMIVSADLAAHQLALHEIATVNAHLVIGALLLATTFALVVRTFRVWGMPTDERVAALGGDDSEVAAPAIDERTPAESIA